MGSPPYILPLPLHCTVRLHLWVQDTKQLAALKEAVELSLLRYRGGRATYLDVLDAEQQLYPAEDALAQIQRDQLSAVVTLYKALGGGWKLSDAAWSMGP